MLNTEQSNRRAPLGIILAAGKGTRMKSDLPKVLCQANGRPLIRYVIDALRSAGLERLIAVIGYRGESVQQALADEARLEFAWQTEQRGTGHAVMMCRQHLERHQGPVVVVAGDSPLLQPASIERLVEEFTAAQAACVLGTLIHSDPTGLGRIVRDASGRFLRIVEERDATDAERAIREVNMSTYLFDAQALCGALDRLTADNQQQEYYITDVPGILLAQGLTVAAHPVLHPLEALSVNTPEQLSEVEQALATLRKTEWAS